MAVFICISFTKLYLINRQLSVYLGHAGRVQLNTDLTHASCISILFSYLFKILYVTMTTQLSWGWTLPQFGSPSRQDYNLPIHNLIYPPPAYRKELDTEGGHLSCASALSHLFWWLDSIQPSNYIWTTFVEPVWPLTPHITSSGACGVWVGTLGLGLFVSSVWVKLQSSATWVCFKCQPFTGA